MPSISPPVIVLVAPQMGENIGAAARAMGNFGLSELRIVAPRDGWPNPAAQAMAAHATSIIEKATIHPSIREAVKDCQRVYATSGHLQEPGLSRNCPHQWAQEFTATPERIKCAVLFGRESSGLSKEELSHAQGIISIPVSAECPSLNLAQAVAVVAYEWFRLQTAGTKTPSGENSLTGSTPERPATQAEIDGFFDQLEEALDEVNFWRVEHKKTLMWRNLRKIFLRRSLTLQEVQTLRGLIKSLQSERNKR